MIAIDKMVRGRGGEAMLGRRRLKIRYQIVFT
jgi:hypothetical protein